MCVKWIFIAVVFLAGLYTTLHYNSKEFREGFGGNPRCPDILIQDGEGLILKNSKLALIPGVNPVRFENLEEYAEFVQWQHSQGIRCPVLYYKKVYDAQSHEGYLPLPLPPINVNAYADKPPQGSKTYPAMDPHPQDIGTKSMLNEYHDVGESLPVSANALDSNWGGANFTMKAIDDGQYKGNEVYMKVG